MIGTTRRTLHSIVTALVAAVGLARWPPRTSAQSAGVSTIKGRVALSGNTPGNVVIRTRVDPMCAKINAGKRVIKEAVVTSADGGLANVFLRVQGSLPPGPAPSEPVVVDQRGCVYV